jgi:hypothetical protein
MFGAGLLLFALRLKDKPETAIAKSQGRDYEFRKRIEV